jgi:hypothetical protein
MFIINLYIKTAKNNTIQYKYNTIIVLIINRSGRSGQSRSAVRPVLSNPVAGQTGPVGPQSKN